MYVLLCGCTASHWSTKDKLQPLQGRTGPVSDSPGPIAEAVEPQAIPTVVPSVTAMHDANPVEANAVVKVFRREYKLPEHGLLQDCQVLIRPYKVACYF